MLIKLVPGADREAALQGLRKAAGDFQNTYASNDRYRAYTECVNSTLGALRHLIRPVDLEALLLTQRYWLLQSLAAMAGSTSVNLLLNAEVEERKTALSDSARELQIYMTHWFREGVFVVPDTSLYITHRAKLEEWDLASLLQDYKMLPQPGYPIHVLVPILVVDELDRLKESRDKKTRWRAGYTLAVIDRLVGPSVTSGQLRGADRAADPTASEVTLEVVLDPPGHIRLPLADDEIIDRAVAVSGFAARPVTIVTYDTGQSMRARSAGLNSIRLPHPSASEGPPAP